APEIEAALAGSTAITVFNPDYAQGQPTSVGCGLRAAGEGNPMLIGLGDQPLLSAEDIRALLTAHAFADTSRISIPAVDQLRGNPIVVPHALRARLLADPKSPGCKKFTRAHPEHVQFHQLTSPGFYADVDTPEAYDAFGAGKLEQAV
ncbi:MAG: NTP transferase domain-containing protein, partial [Marinomonas sp.]